MTITEKTQTIEVNFNDNAYLQAFIILGQFLVLKKDLELFKKWMKKICNANTKQATDCFNCLNDWCELFL